jgi:hypothetical protein
MKRMSVALGLGALAIFVGLFYLYGGHQTPRGQTPLADLNLATSANSRMSSMAAQPTFACWSCFRRLDRSACGGPPHSNHYWKLKQTRICVCS